MALLRRLPLTRPARAALVGLLTLAAAVAGPAPATARPAQETRLGGAVIRYTEYGIPHIMAADFRGLGLGYGYAAAKDNLCVLADTYLTVAGERSRYLGPDAPGNSDLGSASTNLNSDLYYRSIAVSGTVERLAHSPAPVGPDPEVADLVRGYAAGYNRYLAETGPDGVRDPACRGAAWLRPITELDVYRHVYALATLQGGGSDIDGIVTAQPPAGAPAPAPAPSAERMVRAAEDAAAARTLGSNAIAAGSRGTTGGGSVLLGNPHYPWQGTNRFWQSQLTVPGRLDVSGASLLGLPVVAIGHNTDVAWSHTVSTAARFGLHEVPLVPGDPTSYLVDGVPQRMTATEVAVEARQPDGTLATVHRTLWSTRYGPVINAGPGVPLPWGTTAYTLQDPNAGNLRTLNTWLALGRSRSAEGVRTALARTQGLPWLNTVATDRAGQALYADLQVVPNVTDELAARCSTGLGRAVFPSSGISVLDGGRGDCAWGSDPDAVQPGILGPARLPVLARTDYVANANNSPWLTNPAAPLTGYPRVVGDTGTKRSTRTQEAVTAAERRLAGTDGLPGRGFSLRTMQQTLFSDHSRVAELALADTGRMCAGFTDGTAPSAAGPVDVTAGCTALRGWDGRYTEDSRGSLLFERFALRLARIPGGPWQKPFDPADPIATPNTLAVARPEVRQAFGDAAAELRAAGIPLDAPLGEHQYVTRADRRIPVHGAPDLLGVLNVVEPVWDSAAGNTEVRYGSSFVQVVEFPAGAGLPRVTTLLTYSQSSDPTSPHHADQTALFSAGRWVSERFTEAQILASPDLAVTVLNGRR
ncbi:penicillin acylase family protein [Kitasatospora sp. NPDC048545]|uniref:penicillin acylase family protein n=1 Tax=Kitasatospora sp. NPDC048545 TaxID=3157208 RepID=UPI00340BB431